METTEQKNNSLTLWKANTPHEIELSITVQFVGAINAVKETFDATLWIDIFWLPSQHEYKTNSSPTEWDLQSNLQTPTAISLHSFDIKKMPKIKNINGRNMYHAVVQLSGTFSSPFDLHSFPFDCQIISILIEMGNVNNMIYKPCHHISSILSVETQLCVLDEWHFKDASISFTASHPSLSKQGNRYSQCIIKLILPRKWKSFVSRYVVIVSLLVISTLSAYSIDYMDVGQRLEIIFTLLLTLVAFQFIITDQLPPTPYLTFFDQYFASCLFIIFINVFIVSISPTIIDQRGFHDFDIICFYVTMISIIIIHTLFFIQSFKARTKAMEKINHININHHNKLKNIKIFKDNIQYFENEKDDQRFCIYKTN